MQDLAVQAEPLYYKGISACCGGIGWSFAQGHCFLAHSANRQHSANKRRSPLPRNDYVYSIEIVIVLFVSYRRYRISVPCREGLMAYAVSD